jgi:hypothetical protein
MPQAERMHNFLIKLGIAKNYQLMQDVWLNKTPTMVQVTSMAVISPRSPNLVCL